MKAFIYKFFRFIGFRVISNSVDSLRQLEINNLKKENEKLIFLLSDNISKKTELLDYFDSSKSQICQDWFVLEKLSYKKNGYFVEVGAASGVELSNTFLLEKKYQWDGILSEPSPGWKENLEANRKCKKDYRCVYSESGKTVKFNQTVEKEYSTISDFSKSDKHQNKRKSFKQYEIETITLNDLLSEYNAPFEIDYLSIDTEGSEFEILKNLDFKKYSFKVITVEHNNTVNKTLINKLLEKNGYRKELEALSQFESWYTNTSLLT
jgi:FkbM family methyltransferase